MTVFPIRYPGTWLEVGNRDLAWRVQSTLYLLESQATDAFVSVNLFVTARIHDEAGPSDADWEKAAEERSHTEAILIQEIAAQNDVGEHEIRSRLNWDAVREEIERRTSVRRWERGDTPTAYRRRLPFLHAHSFLYAVNSFGAVLSTLAAEPGLPACVVNEDMAFRDAFPSAREVRNSAQHIEDRGRGLGRNKKPLQPKPIVNQFVHAPGGGALMLGNLFNDRLGYTMADGEHGEIAVNVESAGQIQACLQRLLDGLAWRGPARWIPE
jgi:hypothetical protein